MADLTKNDHIAKLNTIIKDVRFSMMTTITNDEKHLHACPMTTREHDL